MNVLDAMQARRSVRRYLSKPVEEEKLQKVLEAVRLTPSRHNEQNIRVIVVQDPQRKHDLRTQANTQEMVEQAGAVLVLCATDQTDFVMPCGQYGYVVDLSLATGFVLLEAAEQGLDTCIVCAFEESAVKKVLEIPDHVRVVSMVVLGYGDDPSPRKEKKPLKSLVCRERF